jgi:hypothetical protein
MRWPLALRRSALGVEVDELEHVFERLDHPLASCLDHGACHGMGVVDAEVRGNRPPSDRVAHRHGMRYERRVRDRKRWSDRVYA